MENNLISAPYGMGMVTIEEYEEIINATMECYERDIEEYYERIENENNI